MAITYPSAYNANSMFFSYGADTDTLRNEVKNDLLDALNTAVKSKYFARSEGLGIESFENESFGNLSEVFTKMQIVFAVEAYNAVVPPERQVVTSQELISIKPDGLGAFVWNIYFFMLSDLTSPEPQSLTIPTGG